MQRTAIIGGGIAGLATAWFLRGRTDITLFEAADYPGGHSNTIVVPETWEDGVQRAVPIDTGFMVFNHVTYPLLTRLFSELGVATKRTDMSFSVADCVSGLEFCGSSVAHLFAQRRNLFRPSFYALLSQIARFNREAVEFLEKPGMLDLSLGEFVAQRGYGERFLNLYLVPMSGAVWSTPPEKMLRFPAAALLRFFHNHGFLGLHTQHPWYTVAGGSREYVARLTESFREKILLSTPARRIRRLAGGGVEVASDREAARFDRVILATHADQALALLGDPTPDEQRLLGAFAYEDNVATLHTDASVMPRTRRAWASWNYRIERGQGSAAETSTHYWMNRLQGVSDRENYFVSINGAEAIDRKKTLRVLSYTHPLFDLAAMRSQAELPELNARALGATETFFAGSYFRYGFHEDALLSAHTLCGLLCDGDPWPFVAAHEKISASAKPAGSSGVS